MVVVGFVAAAPAAAGDREEGGGNGHVWRRVERDLVGGRRLRVEEREGGQVASWSWSDGKGGGVRRVERGFSRDGVATATVGGASSGGGDGGRVSLAEGFPPDGGPGPRAVAGWGWTPGAGGEDELMFPKGAEILEVEDVNGEWFHGFYMGAGGLFPAPYVRVVGGR